MNSRTDSASVSFSARRLAELLHQEERGPVQYPTPEQERVIEAGMEPMLVIAGAGSGKTTTMADRVVWLVANGLVRPEQILGVTFTRKAAGELATRIRGRLNLLYRVLDAVPHAPVNQEDRLEPTVSTYHSFANSIVSDYGLRVGVERDATMLGGAQAWQLANQIVEAYAGEFQHFTAAKSTLVQAVLKMASECAEHLRTPAEVRSDLQDHLRVVESLPYLAGTARKPTQAVDKLLRKLRTRITVTELVDQYLAAKNERGQLDFGDLVAIAAGIALRVPAAVELERTKYKVVLLDEFQDTSSAQLTLFANLFGDGRSVTAVGDPHQSIYGFRGASAGQLADFRSRFRAQNRACADGGTDGFGDTSDGGGTDAAVAHLSVAWRNSTAILAAANAVSAPLSSKAPWLDVNRMPEVPLLQPRPNAPTGEVLVARHVSDEPDPSGASLDSGEAVGVARLVAEQRNRVFDPDQGRALRPSVAVLCRGKRQFEPIRRELEELGIPVQVVGLGGLLSTPEVVDLLAVLRVLGDPGRSDSMLRILSGARWRLGPPDLMALSDWSRHLARLREQPIQHRAEQAGLRDQQASSSLHGTDEGAAGEVRGSDENIAVEQDIAEAGSLVEAVDYLPKPGWISGAGRGLTEVGRARLMDLGRELQVLRSSVGEDITTLIGEVERRMLLDIEVAAKPGIDFHAARRNLDAFIDAAASFTSTAGRVDLQAFLSWLDAAQSEEGGLPVTQLEASRDVVQLLTVHASKGLEWDVVVVPGLNEGSFPSGKDSRWSSGDAAIPWNLRGDAADLPQWDWEQEDQRGWLESEKLFCEDARGHSEREERRLAYVAFTRARHVLACTGSAWGNGRSKATAPSRYLEDLAGLAEAGEPGFSVRTWVAEDDVGLSNPASSRPKRAQWPSDPLVGRRDSMQRAAEAVLLAAENSSEVNLAVENSSTVNSAMTRSAQEPDSVDGGSSGYTQRDIETELVLARHTHPDSRIEVELPRHISASMLVDLKADADGVVRQLRRPVPRKPGLAARKGTAFHAWIEDFYGDAGQLDIPGFPEASDSFVDQTYGLDEMIATFKGSEWAGRSPEAVEVPIETQLDGIVVRGRIDAVFRDDDGGWDLVDWKTGRAPAAEQLAVRAVQLGVYRLAWSRLANVPLDRVRAAFYYVADNLTVRPHDLADEVALEIILTEAYG